MEVVYIFTNMSFPEWIKIGRCKDLDRRIKSLSQNTATPLPFECYYACKVLDARKVERQLHNIFSEQRISTNREFFKVDPEMVVKVLELVSEGEVTTKQEKLGKDLQKVLEKEVSELNKFRFVDAGVALGEEIYLTRFPTIKATVVGQDKLVYEGKSWSLPQLTEELVKTTYGYDRLKTIAPRYWSYDGRTLVALKHVKQADEKG